MTIQGIVMFPKLREYALPKNMSYQDYFVNNENFRDTMILFNDDYQGTWIKTWLNSVNEDAVNKTCQEINMLLYKLLFVSSNVQKRKVQFCFDLINEIQKDSSSEFEDLFKSYMPEIYIYINTKENMKFRWLIVSFIRDWFMEIWITKLMKQIKSPILTTINSQESEMKDNGPVALNDSDVN